jgi:hypothetical protein
MQSHSSKTNLTASKKKRRRTTRRTVKAIEALNGLADCHEKLAALAGLMEACGEMMEAGQVNITGTLIAEQVRRLDELKDTLDEETR